ncbi:DUF6941 family protein [Nonomuraea sp. M3C6]|uniref:DUF6941 family protein n=1 Tax=Nonomuraea marmarensis TaxID=3351344 RepID=A0ABW7AIM6_9ACTN
MEAFIVLCDAAQHDVASGKINVLGGDWSVTDARPTQTAVAMFIRLSWEEATEGRSFTLRLVDDTGKQVRIGEPGEERPIEYGGTLQLNESAADTDPAAKLVDVHNSFAVTVPELPLEPGRRYVWEVRTSGELLSLVAFAVREAPPSPTDV